MQSLVYSCGLTMKKSFVLIKPLRSWVEWICATADGTHVNTGKSSEEIDEILNSEDIQSLFLMFLAVTFEITLFIYFRDQIIRFWWHSHSSLHLSRVQFPTRPT